MVLAHLDSDPRWQSLMEKDVRIKDILALAALVCATQEDQDFIATDIEERVLFNPSIARESMQYFLTPERIEATMDIIDNQLGSLDATEVLYDRKQTSESFSNLYKAFLDFLEEEKLYKARVAFYTLARALEEKGWAEVDAKIGEQTRQNARRLEKDPDT